MSSLVHPLRISVWYLTVLGLLCTRYIHKRIYNELDVKKSLLCENRVIVKLILLLNCSNLVCHAEHFDASESVSPIRSIESKSCLRSFFSPKPSVCRCHSPCHLWSLLSSPDYPLIIIIALSLFVSPSFCIPFSISSGCWPLTTPRPPIFSPSSRQGPSGR